MPLILPLLEQKQKQVYNDLQEELNKMFHILQDITSSDFFELVLISKWISDVTPSERALIKISKEYEDLITAITEEYMEINEKKLIKIYDKAIVAIPNLKWGMR